MKDNIILLLSDARGSYIPRDFVTYDDDICAAWGISSESAAILKNPDHEGYWEGWDSVLQNARFTDTDGKVYSLYQDGDLWGIAYDSMSDTEKSEFFGEE